MDLVDIKTPKFVQGKSLVPLLQNSENKVRKSALTELQVNTKNGIAQGYSIKTKRYRLSRWKHLGEYSYELYDHDTDKAELDNLAKHPDYIKVKDSLITILNERVLASNKIPEGLGRQIRNARPWFEPKKIHSKPKKIKSQ